MGSAPVLPSGISPEEAVDERTQRGPPLRQGPRHRVEVAAVVVTPSPGFAALVRRDHGVTRGLEMGKGMSVPGVLATPDMTAGETDAQLVPRRPDGHAPFAAIRAWLHLSYLGKMLALLGRVRGHCAGVDLSTREGELLAKHLLARRGKADHARTLDATRPAHVQTAVQHCRPHSAGQVAASHAPVQTRAA